MKSILALFIFLSAHLCIAQTTSYCHARGGLSIRRSPNVAAHLDTIVPYGSEVKILSTGDVETSLKGIVGHWAKVEFAGRKGYAFDGYLSEIPYYEPKERYPYLYEYAYANYKWKKGSKGVDMEKYPNDVATFFEDDIRYDFVGGDCDIDENLYLPDVTLQECIVVFAAYLRSYNEYDLRKSKYVWDEEVNALTHDFSIEPDESFPQYFNNRIKFFEDGSLRLLSIYFDWEGGGGGVTFEQLNERFIKISHHYYCH